MSGIEELFGGRKPQNVAFAGPDRKTLSFAFLTTRDHNPAPIRPAYNLDRCCRMAFALNRQFAEGSGASYTRPQMRPHAKLSENSVHIHGLAGPTRLYPGAEEVPNV